MDIFYILIVAAVSWHQNSTNCTLYVDVSSASIKLIYKDTYGEAPWGPLEWKGNPSCIEMAAKRPKRRWLQVHSFTDEEGRAERRWGYHHLSECFLKSSLHDCPQQRVSFEYMHSCQSPRSQLSGFTWRLKTPTGTSQPTVHSAGRVLARSNLCLIAFKPSPPSAWNSCHAEALTVSADNWLMCSERCFLWFPPVLL